ncbi:type IV toxin-antitoxin system AbiEi family antitoxin [Corynebacterium vitaeruminis]|uniref:type IV toxin-antitoxin system AbiEi family antitoxin n=1 Tax=Corynebacterium vitaeruminis TaxID=38305 RepID=UPI00046D7D0D|nr:type IV toxin-antitoxin system AbiEi family antitoxin [Corynebacterium vitaeruminis]
MTAELFQDWNERLERASVPIRLYSTGPSRPHELVEGVTEAPARLQVVHEGPLNDAAFVVYEVESFEPIRKLMQILGNYRLNTPSVKDTRAPIDAKRGMLLAPQIRPREAERLREMGVAFADYRGNCFLSLPESLIDIRGKTAPAPSEGKAASASRRSKRRAAALFTPRRAQVAAMLLSYPMLLSSSVREIAWAANVSTGTAAGALKLFAESGYLFSMGDRYCFRSATLMLSAWAREYPSGLGRQLSRFDGVGDLARIAEGDRLGWVSGDLAVSDLISTLEGIFYVEDETTARRLVREGRVRLNTGENSSRRVAGGTALGVSINQAFWAGTVLRQLEAREGSPSFRQRGTWARWEVAPLAVIYADLINNVDPRLHEVSVRVEEAMAARWEAHGFGKP